MKDKSWYHTSNIPLRYRRIITVVMFVSLVGLAFYRSDQAVSRSNSAVASAQEATANAASLAAQLSQSNDIQTYNLCIAQNETRSAVRDTINGIINLGTNQAIKDFVSEIQHETIDPLVCPADPGISLPGKSGGS